MMPGAFGMVNPMALQMGLQTAGSGLLPPPGVALTANLACAAGMQSRTSGTCQLAPLSAVSCAFLPPETA